MPEHAPILPRDGASLHALHATRIAAQALRVLPIGYWQRRLAARAFSLELMPVMPRESLHVQARRLADHPGVWLLVTEAMAWGLVPWVWSGPLDRRVDGARAAMRAFQRAAPRAFGAVLFVTAPDDTTTRAVLHRIRPVGLAATYLAIGAVSWDQLDECFEDAADDLPQAGARAAALRASRRLAQLTTACP
ncbi:hypothetical protein TBR22_A15090 [Luteitalea sp. TBR-22]|uniref:hypothetical protein n=1 Tax=Luteitalea sp. TBR-22 TaxID=2802971 RepID=UPI001AF7D2D6|nr:hypothetical protein [Luteitalea sp. TBR-22]BCS32299.1 hypothetical protein TBR22_A15090 [Luteitalea sp. TBR-22]